MATHIIINPDVDAYSTADKAFLDVAGEPTAADVTFTVFPPGAPPKTVKVAMNARNFATSPDLFALSGGRSALVVAVTTDRTTPSAAVLRQEGRVKHAMSAPSSNRVLGTSFNIPVGDLPSGATLYFGNNNGTDANVVVQCGSSMAPPAGTVRVPAMSLAKFKLTQDDANVLVTVSNRVPIVVQVVFGSRVVLVSPIGPAV